MFILNKRINFYDCDPAGIIFYARIYELCHSAYEALIESFNLTFNYWNNDDYIVPIIKSFADYLMPLKPGEEITINVAVSMLKNSSFELSYECINRKSQVCIKVKTVHVWVDKKSWQKTEMPKELKLKLEKSAV